MGSGTITSMVADRLTLSWARIARVGRVLVILTLIGPLATGLLTWAGCDPLAINDGDTRTPLGLISGPAFAIIGSLIFVYRPHNRIGWLCLWLSFSLPAVNALDLYVTCGVSGTISAPGMSYVAWFNYSYGVMVLFPLMFLLPMVYPTGRFLSPRWRRTAVAGLVTYALIGTAVGLVPDFSQGNLFYSYPLTNPFGFQQLPEWWSPLFYALLHFGFMALNLVGAAAMVVRFRRSVGDERLQMKWLAYFLTTALGIQMFFFNLPGAFFYPQVFETVWFDLILSIIFLGFPVVIGIAIFKYRLYKIDEVISRTLIYGGLTVMIIAIYSITVGGFSLLFQSSGNFVASLIATGIIAVIFQPVRERLQRWVNRLIFGERDDPYTVISQLNQSLQATAVPQETLTTIAQNIANILKLPHVDIQLIDDSVQIGRASVGQPVGTPLELPLTYQRDNVGRLTISPRTPNEPFNPQEQQLLADIAAQIGPVASATRLTMALQRSRENLVLAREEERRRIRRDLHDGLGPTLASQTLKLDSVLELLDEEDADTASQHVTELKGQTQQMVADIRRLVYELRPPALDELGLIEALRAHFGAGSNGQLAISIGADPEPLPDLPAAIEVAAYRTILEAVTNVIKHAKAGHCNVQLTIHKTRTVSNLHVTVTDDGVGLPQKRKVGVGLVSMRERAEELGGRCSIKSTPNGGTQIAVIFPYTPTE
ncbi:MAG: ATP-binding protein, partial [Chloroflexota bacterium]